MWSKQYAVWSVKCKVQKCGESSVEWQVKSVECKVQGVKCKVWSGKCEVWSVECGV